MKLFTDFNRIEQEYDPNNKDSDHILIDGKLVAQLLMDEDAHILMIDTVNNYEAENYSLTKQKDVDHVLVKDYKELGEIVKKLDPNAFDELKYFYPEWTN